jgi:colanic acid/amylovoran biosynthesis protein
MNEHVRPEGAAAAAAAPKPAVRVCLMGATFDTGNMGVSALTESSLKCILARWPTAQVTLLGGTRQDGEDRLQLSGREVVLPKVPIRFCKNIFLPCHFCTLAVRAALLRLLPFASLRKLLARRNRYLGLLLETDYFIDIAGGDSFSDIYGMWRLTRGFLTRLLPLMLKKDLVLFPQTYGPFRRAVSRGMARYILRRSKRIYSRDRAGLDYVGRLVGTTTGNGKVRFAPDVAFLLDPRRPPELDVGALNDVRTDSSVLVGLNVSGLLYYGGYTGRNEFGLKTDYKALIDRLVQFLFEKDDTLVLLVPHVIPTGGFRANVENDLSACLDVYDRLSKSYPNRLFIARGRYDHCESKYLIGMCDFFIGTRMHSCIAALSQCIPAVGLAYSVKFRGVFGTVGLDDLVVDLRCTDTDGVLTAIDDIFVSRESVTQRLQAEIPLLKQQVLGLLQDINS